MSNLKPTKLSSNFNVPGAVLVYDGVKRKEVPIETPPEGYFKGKAGTPQTGQSPAFEPDVLQTK
jgi:hypothetical protein